MEHIISKHLLNHLEANDILFDKQHGFRKKQSTDTQLLAFTQDILANLSGGRQTDVIIMDFAKVFDKVPHHRTSSLIGPVLYIPYYCLPWHPLSIMSFISGISDDTVSFDEIAVLFKYLSQNVGFLCP